MELLVLVKAYPDDSGGRMMYVHMRNQYYKERGVKVTVLNFSANCDYIIDDIQVITLRTYKKSSLMYETLVLHAPNIRNHYIFLRKYMNRFSRLIFFYHGHEILKVQEVYPPPYPYMKQNSIFQIWLQKCYDLLKLWIWHCYLLKVLPKSEVIFVSECLFKEFQQYVKISDKELKGHIHIIHNSVSKVFEEHSWNHEGIKEYDFITIRSDLDSSVYCMDMICRLAESNTDLSFLVIGQGKYMTYNQMPNNIKVVSKFLKHEEMIEYLNLCRCALMPTRRDSQGVMSCELMTFGIPLITSDLPVCREMFEGIKSVIISNFESKTVLKDSLQYFKNNNLHQKIDIFGHASTVDAEIVLITGKSS